MARINHAFFQEHLGLAECLAGFRYDPVVVLEQFFFAVAAAYAAPAATIGRF